jgi:uncharacterized protein (TIGR02599 family)
MTTSHLNFMMPRFRHPAVKDARGFTLVEMLVSMVILAIIMLLAAQMISNTEKVWQTTSARIESFQGARAGFELMTDQLRQATVNTYYDYYEANGTTQEQWDASVGASGISGTSTTATTFEATTYGRQSDLHFISGPTATKPGSPEVGPALGGLAGPPGVQVITQGVFFQTPANYTDTSTYNVLQTLINATGFFVEFGPDVYATHTPWVINGPPTSLFPNYTPVYRFRLMQFIQPSENLSVYTYGTTPTTDSNAWFVNPITTNHAGTVRVVADNVIALIVWPMLTDSPTDTLSPNYVYDSRLGEPSGTPAWIPGATDKNPQPLQMNQMPPILRVAMVTIDEPSATALQGTSTTAPTEITNALTAVNTNTSAQLFTVPQNMDSDLAYLQTELGAITTHHVNFRIFDTTLAERSAKFSTQ